MWINISALIHNKCVSLGRKIYKPQNLYLYGGKVIKDIKLYNQSEALNKLLPVQKLLNDFPQLLSSSSQKILQKADVSF